MRLSKNPQKWHTKKYPQNETQKNYPQKWHTKISIKMRLTKIIHKNGLTIQKHDPQKCFTKITHKKWDSQNWSTKIIHKTAQ